MNSINEAAKQEFIKTFYYEKEYISFEEYNKFTAEGNEDVGVETEDGNEENGRCFKKIYKDFTYEELQEYSYMKSLDLNLRILNNLRALNDNNKAIRRLLSWLVFLVVLGLFLLLFILNKTH